MSSNIVELHQGRAVRKHSEALPGPTATQNKALVINAVRQELRPVRQPARS